MFLIEGGGVLIWFAEKLKKKSIRKSKILDIFFKNKGLLWSGNRFYGLIYFGNKK